MFNFDTKDYFRYHIHVETEDGKKQLSINQEEKRKQIMHSSTFTSAAHLYLTCL